MGVTLELKEPCIIVPLNQSALDKLYLRNFQDLDCSYFFIERHSLYKIFATGFFDFLNEKYNLMIADYEYEEVTKVDKLKAILLDVNEYEKKSNSHMKPFLSNLEKSLGLAIENNTGIFFFF